MIMRNPVTTLFLLACLILLGGGVDAEAQVRHGCVPRWEATTKTYTVAKVVYETVYRNGRLVVVPRIVYEQVTYTSYRLVWDCF